MPLQVEWARARVEVFTFISVARTAGDALAMERGLKWHLILHDVLLRGPFRSSRGPGRPTTIVAQRFQLWRDGDRAALLRHWRDDRAKAQRRHEERRTLRGMRAHLESDEAFEQRVHRVHELIRDGEISHALRLLHSDGIAGLTPG